MSDGVLAELAVGGSVGCAVAPLSEETAIHSVSRSKLAASDGEVAVEFTATGNVDAGGADDAADGGSADDAARTPDVDLDRVFAFDEGEVYRYEHDYVDACVCATIERCGAPVRRTHVDDGTVVVSFIAESVPALRTVVETLQTRFDDVAVRRLTRTPPEDGHAELVLVDRTALTDRQTEVLATAHRLGYFSRPREANATAVADELGISVATFAEHLAAAQSKLLDAVLDG